MALSEKFRSRFFVIILLVIIILPVCYGLLKERVTRHTNAPLPAVGNSASK